MSDRFFSEVPITGNDVTLDGPEAHHLLHVMRAKEGQTLALFDDSGAEFLSEIVRLGRSAVELRIVERRMVDRELSLRLTVGVALPKGDRQKWLVEKLTELGVTTLVPLSTSRSVAQPTGGAIDRLRRVVIEASKQCGRNRLMRIEAAHGWEQWLRRGEESELRVLAHPGGASLGELARRSGESACVAIGPEGGFSAEEVASATTAGWQAVSLGSRVLRVETAAVAASVAMAYLAPAQS